MEVLILIGKIYFNLTFFLQLLKTWWFVYLISAFSGVNVYHLDMLGSLKYHFKIIIYFIPFKNPKYLLPQEAILAHSDYFYFFLPSSHLYEKHIFLANFFLYYFKLYYLLINLKQTFKALECRYIILFRIFKRHLNRI